MIPLLALADLEAGEAGTLDRLHDALRAHTLVHIDARAELGPEFFRALHEQTRAFFALPEEAKRALDIDASPNYRGHVAQGAEYTGGVPDLKESFEFGRETAAPEGEQLPWHTGLFGPNQWPDPAVLPRFRPVVEAYSAAVERVARAVLRGLLLTLDQKADGDGTVADGELCSYSRLIRYRDPSGFGADQSRLERHTDSGLLTVSLQEQHGLEAETADGRWVAVQPPADVFTVFGGELLEVWTHGYYRACPHRVHNSALRAERLSYASFFLPDLNRPLVPVDRAAGVRLSGPVAVPAGNSWLAGGRELSPTVPVGELEWARMNVIFPGRNNDGTDTENGEGQ
ncbi:2-oxoglutarate and iron-dependent oxygenase domain-containing protein [Streptomyces sp. NPDC096198]|uniref:2-oxoglutarate and iron-dependent oxygenase domain-containing protein n=1 Tax=Streptomyces sp. NPDC096198 TaxID=3366080 RepID=UPI0037F90DED